MPFCVLDHDLAELLGVGQPAFDIDRKLELAFFAVGRTVDDAGRHLDVLPADGVDDVVGGQPELGDLLRD